MSNSIEVLGNNRLKRYCKLLEDGDLEVNYEVDGGDYGPDQETILVISKEEFPAIIARYGYDPATSILEALEKLSASGRGDKFIQELWDKTIPLKSKFVF